jgi:hypothetical protein
LIKFWKQAVLGCFGEYRLKLGKHFTLRLPIPGLGGNSSVARIKKLLIEALDLFDGHSSTALSCDKSILTRRD